MWTCDEARPVRIALPFFGRAALDVLPTCPSAHQLLFSACAIGYCTIFLALLVRTHYQCSLIY